MEKMSKADLEKEEILNPEKAEKRRRRNLNFACKLH